MNDPAVVIALTLLALFVPWLVLALVVARGSLRRYWNAQALAFRWLRDPEFAAKVDELNQPPRPPEPPKPSPEPLRFLTLLQREGRLLDFLLEDIQAYTDDQIGAAVRDIQSKSKKAIKEHLVLEPVLAQPENTTVEVPPNFDPSAIRLVGNVTGQPPFRGTLLHAGWRVKEIRLGPLPEGQDHFVVMPAEVELP